MFKISKSAIEIIVAVAIVTFSICFCFYKIEYENKSMAAVTYNFNGINNRQLFEFVTYPDTVNKWFRWVSHFRSGDSQPLCVGKIYHTYFNDELMEMRVDKYVPNELIILTSESLLRPLIEIRTLPITKNSSKLIISVSFRRSSALFQLSIGPILRDITLKRIQEAVRNLKNMLKHHSQYSIYDPPSWTVV